MVATPDIRPLSLRQRLAMWLATGAGVGYLPKAPGTAGSLLGVFLGSLVWRHCDAWPSRSWAVATACAVAGILLGVAISTVAEENLQTVDPPCVVIDEIVAMALIMLLMPSALRTSKGVLLAFALFRLFDISKPAPLKGLARMPRGWGIMLDDLGAALYALALLWVVAVRFVG